MLRATFRNKYRKPNGHTIYTYLVSGTVAETDEYKAVQAAATNKTPEEWANDNGKPLFFVDTTMLARRGQTAQSSINLVFNRDKTRVFVDDTEQERAYDAKVSNLMAEKEAELKVKLKYGLTELPSNLPMTPNAPVVTEPVGEGNKKLEVIIENIGANETLGA